MPKFRIHAFVEVRETYEVEAEDREAAAALFDDAVVNQDPVEVESTQVYMDYYLIDPLLENGEVDYDNTKWYGEQ